MAQTIMIGLAELNSTAKRVRNLNLSMLERLNNIENEMNRLSDTWQSNAGNQIRERFAALKPAFEDYRQVIENYALFLENTAANYEAAEQAIYIQASQF